MAPYPLHIRFCAVVHVYSSHAHVTMRTETSKFRTPRLLVENTATEARGTERMAAAGGAKTEAVSYRRQWRLGRGVHGAHSHLPQLLAPPAQSREGGRRQGERWGACKRCTFLLVVLDTPSCRRGFGRAGYKHVRTKKRRRVPIGSRGLLARGATLGGVLQEFRVAYMARLPSAISHPLRLFPPTNILTSARWLKKGVSSEDTAHSFWAHRQTLCQSS